MKLTKWIIGIAVLTAGLLSCSKDEDNTVKTGNDVENTPGAVAAYDHSSAGVYKGVLVGSSGYFKISLKNGTDTISCKMVFDDKTAYLTTTALNNWQPGTAISNAVFTGTIDGQNVTLTLNCSADGTTVSVSVNYPGHTIGVAIVKETSTTLVKCYEGTHTDGKQTGVFNLAVYGNKVYGFRKDPEGVGSFTGFVNGSTMTIDEENPKTFTIDDKEINGSFNADNNVKITVKGTRSL
jgi:hypothetical protein